MKTKKEIEKLRKELEWLENNAFRCHGRGASGCIMEIDGTTHDVIPGCYRHNMFLSHYYQSLKQELRSLEHNKKAKQKMRKQNKKYGIK